MFAFPSWFHGVPVELVEAAVLLQPTLAGEFPDGCIDDCGPKVRPPIALGELGNITRTHAGFFAFENGQHHFRHGREAVRFALLWLDLVVSEFPPSGKDQRNTTVDALHLVASKMSPVQLAEAQQLAFEWIERRHRAQQKNLAVILR